MSKELRMTDFNPSIRLLVLYEKTSAKGNMYLTGSLGGNKVAVLRTSKTTEDGQAMWNVMLSEKQQQRQEPSLKDKVKASFEEKDFTLTDDEIPY